MFDHEAFSDLIARKAALLLEQSIGDDVLTTDEAAQLLRLHPVTVSALAAAGDLPARKVGKVWRFRRSALLNHITNTAEIGVRQPLQLAGD